MVVASSKGRKICLESVAVFEATVKHVLCLGTSFKVYCTCIITLLMYNRCQELPKGDKSNQFFSVMSTGYSSCNAEKQGPQLKATHFFCQYELPFLDQDVP